MRGKTSRNPLKEKARAYAKRLAKIIHEKNYTKPESALAIIQDSRYQNAVKKKIKGLLPVRTVVLIGIGGSSLGTEAVYGALDATLSTRLFVLDTLDYVRMRAYRELIDSTTNVRDLAFVIISKSGTTTETLANAVEALTIAEEKFKDKIYKRVVMVGGEGSALKSLARKKKLIWLDFPDSIGGRFSVFTAVGTVPLMLMGVDTEDFRKGAVSALTDEELALSAKYAALLAMLPEEGIRIIDTFVFDRSLSGYAAWYRQLFAESIGKKTTKKGAPFMDVLLPTVSTAADLHSVAQLYLSGKRGIFTHFMLASNKFSEAALPKHWLLSALPMLVEKTSEEILGAISRGVLEAYTEETLPFSVTTIPQISAYELGRLMARAMSEVMMLAAIFDIDAFDQPNVESYKAHTRAALEA